MNDYQEAGNSYLYIISANQKEGSGRSPGNGNGNPLQYSCLENFVDREAWQAVYSPWCCKELDITERLTLSLFQYASQEKLFLYRWPLRNQKRTPSVKTLYVEVQVGNLILSERLYQLYLLPSFKKILCFKNQYTEVFQFF